MGTQTIREYIAEAIDGLPDTAMEKLANYIDFLYYEGGRRHFNAETIAAIKELEEGRGEAVTLEQFKAELGALAKEEPSA